MLPFSLKIQNPVVMCLKFILAGEVQEGKGGWLGGVPRLGSGVKEQ